MRRRKYTNKQLEEAVAASYTIRAVLDKIGLTPAGGNYEMIQKRIQELGLDTAHFLGSAVLKGTTHDYNTRSLDQVLVEGKVENTWRLRNRPSRRPKRTSL
jgi:hypothetical protein